MVQRGNIMKRSILVCATVLMTAAGVATAQVSEQTVQTLRVEDPSNPMNSIRLQPPTGITSYALTWPASLAAGTWTFVINGSTGTMSWVDPTTLGNGPVEIASTGNYNLRRVASLNNIAPVGVGQYANDFSGFRSSSGRTATGQYSAILGGSDNLASGQYSLVGGGNGNASSGQYSLVVGGNGNQAQAQYAAVLGGNGNQATGQYSLAVGGNGNQATGQYSLIVGGQGNQATNTYAMVLGGQSNTASSNGSIVVGGQSNANSSNLGFIGSGNNNTSSGNKAIIVGGQSNTNTANIGFLGGGASNTVSGNIAVAVGGQNNSASGDRASVVGGQGNIASGGLSFVGGGETNTAGANYSAVLGGQNNVVNNQYSSVLGGQNLTLSANNTAGFNSGSAMTLGTANTVVFGNNNVWLANNNNTASELRFYEPTSTTGAFPPSGVNYAAFKAAPTMANDNTYTLPASVGNVNDVLVMDTKTGNNATTKWSSVAGILSVTGYPSVQANVPAATDNVTLDAAQYSAFYIQSDNGVGGDDDILSIINPTPGQVIYVYWANDTQNDVTIAGIPFVVPNGADVGVTLIYLNGGWRCVGSFVQP